MEIPPDLIAALKTNKKAHAAFEKLSPSHQKEYVQWITQAKRPETRQRRIAATLQRLTAPKIIQRKKPAVLNRMGKS